MNDMKRLGRELSRRASKAKLTEMERNAIYLLKQSLGDSALEAILFALFQATQEAVKGRDELIIRSIKLTLNNFFEYELVQDEDGNVSEGKSGFIADEKAK